MNEQDWKDIEAEVKRDLAAIITDQDVYAFMDKYFSREYLPTYRQLYYSDRHVMNRTPRQALANILSLPPL